MDVHTKVRVDTVLKFSFDGSLLMDVHTKKNYIMRKVVGDSYVSGIVNSGHSLCPVRYRNPFTQIAGSIQKV